VHYSLIPVCEVNSCSYSRLKIALNAGQSSLIPGVEDE
jgi:hypothetical protein